MKKDYFLQKEIENKFSKEEIYSILLILSEETVLDKYDVVSMEQFFVQIKKLGDLNWFDTLVEFCKIYEVNMDSILKNTNILQKVKAEIIGQKLSVAKFTKLY